MNTTTTDGYTEETTTQTKHQRAFVKLADMSRNDITALSLDTADMAIALNANAEKSKIAGPISGGNLVMRLCADFGGDINAIVAALNA